MHTPIKIFFDGSCLRNPGPGGYGAIIQYEKHEKIFNSGFYLTTNNRMELMGIIIPLESLKKSFSIIITTDSQYVRQGILIWINNWKKRKWKTTKNTCVKNIDLWTRLDRVLNIHKAEWKWIKSHSGHKENERCDIIAKKSANNPIVQDYGYSSYN